MAYAGGGCPCRSWRWVIGRIMNDGTFGHCLKSFVDLVLEGF